MPILALGDLELHPDDFKGPLDKVLEGVKASVNKHYNSDIYHAPLIGPIARKIKDAIFGAPVVIYAGDTVSEKTQSAALKVACDIVYKARNNELNGDLSKYINEAGYKFSDESLGSDLANVYGDVLFNEGLTDDVVCGFYAKVHRKLNYFAKRNKVKICMNLGNNDPSEEVFAPRYEALAKSEKLRNLVFINNEVKRVKGYRIAAMNGSPEMSNTLVATVDGFFNGLISDNKVRAKAFDEYKSLVTCTTGFDEASKKLLDYKGRLDVLLVHKAYNNIDGEFKWGRSPGYGGDEIDGIVQKLVKGLKTRIVVSGHAHGGAGLKKDGIYYVNPGIRGVACVNNVFTDTLELILGPSGDLSDEQVSVIGNNLVKSLNELLAESAA